MDFKQWEELVYSHETKYEFIRRFITEDKNIVIHVMGVYWNSCSMRVEYFEDEEFNYQTLSIQDWNEFYTEYKGKSNG